MDFEEILLQKKGEETKEIQISFGKKLLLAVECQGKRVMDLTHYKIGLPNWLSRSGDTLSCTKDQAWLIDYKGNLECLT